MIPAGTPVIAMDANVRDVYNAILMEDWDPYHYRNPLVRIETMIRYPRQTAIMYTQAAHEQAPLKCGRICRLLVVYTRSTPTTSGSYEESLERALISEIQHAAQHGHTDCLEILERHQRGIILDHRTVCGP